MRRIKRWLCAVDIHWYSLVSTRMFYGKRLEVKRCDRCGKEVQTWYTG